MKTTDSAASKPLTDGSRTEIYYAAIANPISPAPPQRNIPPFRWSWKLIRVAGIDVYLHGTFLLLIAFLAFGDFAVGRATVVVAGRTLLLLAVFATVILHEFGHALMARRFGVLTHDITLLPIGGIARLAKLPDSPKQQLLVALAGPAVNVGVAAGLFAVLSVVNGTPSFAGVRGGAGPFLAQLMWINLSLAAFNLLPGFPMDGGRVLRALLATRLNSERATQIAARVGQVVAVLLGLAGLFLSPVLMILAVFVWMGAQAEHSMSAMKSALVGVEVRHGMVSVFESLCPRDALSRAVELTVSRNQQDFPVLQGEQLVGILSHSDLLSALAARGPRSFVVESMRTTFDFVAPNEPLEAVLLRMRQGETRVVMVVDQAKLVGLLSLANVGDLVALGAGDQSARGPFAEITSVAAQLCRDRGAH